MSSPTLRLPGSVTEVDGSPEGPEIGAFFDLDGTLIAGYSARYLAADRMRRRELGLGEVMRTLGVAVGAGVGRAGFEDLLKIGAEAWRGRAHEDLEEMGERLFRQKIEPLLFPETRELVRAHQRRGHTVVLSSSATSYQVEPVARFLGIDRVLCNRFSTRDGLLTGDVDTPVLWGRGKADAVQKLAAELGVDLSRSYFYADGDEDLALMSLVGHPRPINPGRKLASVAARRGWPVLRLTSRGAGSPVRAIAGMATLVPVGAAGLVAGLLRRDRRAAINFVTSRWLDLVFAVNGVRFNVVGRENLDAQRPAVFIFNHRNYFDPFIAARLVERDFTAVAKKELERNLLIGPAAKLADVAFVERSHTTAAVASLAPLPQLAGKGLSVIVAPEGTRVDTTEVGPFKKGAFRIAMAAGIPIVPIVIRNADLIGARGASIMNPGTVDVAVLPPIPVDSWTLDELGERIDDVRRLFLDTLADWPA